MTIEEIAALQLGDIIQFPDSKHAEVKSTNNVDKTISLRMLSGTESIAVGDLPPELQNVDTLCVCLWADLSTAEFVSNVAPLEYKVSTPFIGVLPMPKLPERRKAVAIDSKAMVIPTEMPMPMVAPKAPGDELTPAGTVLNVPLEPPDVTGPPSPIPPTP